MVAMEMTSQLVAGLSRNGFGVQTGKRNLACGLEKIDANTCMLQTCDDVRGRESNPCPPDLALAVGTNEAKGPL